jgi:MFS family permease
LLGGYWADRSRNLRMFVFVPLVVVLALLILIPVVPNQALCALGIAIGFSLIFGFAAWLAVPARVSHIGHQFIGTATRLMLALAAIGGFFLPIAFGHLVPHTSFDTRWVFLAIVSLSFSLVSLAGRNPVQNPMVTAKAIGVCGLACPSLDLRRDRCGRAQSFGRGFNPQSALKRSTGRGQRWASVGLAFGRISASGLRFLMESIREVLIMAGASPERKVKLLE